ncbi:MAG: radical SAM protein [Planctomycetes bacterium]|nr:radical SAM protein [Planctomycetota bacterium]
MALEFAEVLRTSDRLRAGIRNVEISDFGATAKPRGKDLSPGCRACKGASWICVLIGYGCNLDCRFCTQVDSHDDAMDPWACGGDGSIRTIEDIERVAEVVPVTGLSYSGGEPLQYLDRVLEWARHFARTRPDVYQWIYTNGLLVTEENASRLADAGIREIRFNLAATDYSRKVLDRMEAARRRVERLCVEVPVMHWQLQGLLRTLPILDDLGVDFLNLHELRLHGSSRLHYEKEALIDPGQIYRNADYSDLPFYLPSLIDIYEAIRFIEDRNLRIIYNECGSRNYLLQDLAFWYQRRMMSPDCPRETFQEYLRKVDQVGGLRMKSPAPGEQGDRASFA